MHARDHSDAALRHANGEHWTAACAARIIGSPSRSGTLKRNPYNAPLRHATVPTSRRPPGSFMQIVSPMTAVASSMRRDMPLREIFRTVASASDGPKSTVMHHATDHLASFLRSAMPGTSTLPSRVRQGERPLAHVDRITAISEQSCDASGVSHCPAATRSDANRHDVWLERSRHTPARTSR